MAMVLLVGPHCLGTRQALMIGENKMHRPVSKSAKGFSAGIKKRKGDAPLNLFKGDVIKTPQHFPLHLLKGPCMASNAKLKFCCAPVLLDEV